MCGALLLHVGAAGLAAVGVLAASGLLAYRWLGGRAADGVGPPGP